MSRATLPPRPDPRALRILNRTYWSATGSVHPPAYPDADDFVFAEAAGAMFRTKKLDHAGAIRWARDGAHAVTARFVSDAFLASLTARRPEFRSAVASYHLAVTLPEHEFETRSAESLGRRPILSICVVCGRIGNEEEEQDLNVLNFERLKWGGTRFTDPTYIGFDLARAATWSAIEPLEQDVKHMRDLLASIRQLARSEPHARPQQLEKTIAAVMDEGRYQRRVVLEILAFCGVLQPHGRPSFAQGWIRYDERPEPAEWKNGWSYPMHAWRGIDGIDDRRLTEVFPRLA